MDDLHAALAGLGGHPPSQVPARSATTDDAHLGAHREPTGAAAGDHMHPHRRDTTIMSTTTEAPAMSNTGQAALAAVEALYAAFDAFDT